MHETEIEQVVLERLREAMLREIMNGEIEL